jgi:monoamine oxidase
VALRAWSPEGELKATWAGGPKAIDLARENAEQRQRLALGALAALFDQPGGASGETLRGVHQHFFSNDPRARGAYSFCRPGGAKASEALSVPLANALFLAGETTNHRYPGTLAGAIASGERAAGEVLESLAR